MAYPIKLKYTALRTAMGTWGSRTDKAEAKVQGDVLLFYTMFYTMK